MYSECNKLQGVLCRLMLNNLFDFEMWCARERKSGNIWAVAT